MGDIIRLADHLYPWKQIFACEGECSTLQVYVNEGTGELEVVQMNDDNEAIRTCLTTVDSVALGTVIARAHQKVGKK